MVGAAGRILLVVNPTAAFGRNRELGGQLATELARLGLDAVPLVAPDAAGLRARLAAELDTVPLPRAIVVVGGDGMVNLAVEVLASRPDWLDGVALGVVPAGTGNDFARTLRLARASAAESAARIASSLSRSERRIDLGRARFGTTERWFANAICMGFDALVNERANRMRRPRGALRYLLALVVELARLRPLDYTIRLGDGRDLSGPAVLVTVANGRSIGGGMRVTPDSEFDDGELDLMLVAPLGRLAFARIFPRVFRGTHVSDRRVRIERVRELTVAASGVIAYGDGERFDRLPVTIEVMPRALRLLAPGPAAPDRARS